MVYAWQVKEGGGGGRRNKSAIEMADDTTLSNFRVENLTLSSFNRSLSTGKQNRIIYDISGREKGGKIRKKCQSFFNNGIRGITA